MADEDDVVSTTSDVEPDTTSQRYGRANNTYNTYTTKSNRRRKEMATETHHSIDQQMEAFLKSGKKIQKISHGVSGLPEIQPGGRRHIHIGSKYRTA